MSTLFLVAAAVAFLASFGLLIMTFTLGSKSKPGPELSPAVMREHILWHCFYVNPSDPRGWVGKTSGFGLTVNFRNKTNATIFLLLISVALASLTLCLVAGPSL